VVRGLDVFREYFAGHADQFVLIGGTAATLAMEEAGLEFRATKDLDIVLHIEALSPSFGEVFWSFVEAGEAKSMKEIARREGVDDSYVSRMVNLTTLVPDIVAAILDETLPAEVTLFELAAGTPVVWEVQRVRVEWGRSTFPMP